MSADKNCVPCGAGERYKSKDFSWYFRALDCNFLGLPSAMYENCRFTKVAIVIVAVVVVSVHWNPQKYNGVCNDDDDVILVKIFSRMNSDDKLSFSYLKNYTEAK